MIPISINDPAVRVLRQIQRERFPEAIIAGGAPRDLFLEQPIKDFDIFIKDRAGATDPQFWCNLFGLEHLVEHEWMDIQTMAFMSFRNILMNAKDKAPANVNTSGYEVKQHLRQVFDMIIHDVIFQVIVVDIDPKEYVEDWFDFGLCKAWCDGTRFHYTGPFMEDVRNRTLTVVQKKMSRPEMEFCLKVRKPRLLAKYPGYTFKVAPHLADLYNETYNRLNK